MEKYVSLAKELKMTSARLIVPTDIHLIFGQC